MRVTHVQDVAFVASTLVAELRRAGVDADLLRPWQPGAAVPYPWKLAAIPLRAVGIAAAVAQLRARRDDLVHVHYARTGLIGALSGAPYVMHCHGSDIRGVTPSSTWGRYLHPLLRRAALVYYSTPDLERDVQRFRPDAEFLPNPTEVPVAAPGAATAPGEPMRDLIVAVRLDPVKGSDAIADLLAAVVASRPTTITLIAQGMDLRRVAARAGGSVRVIPPVPHAAMPALLRRHRIAIGQLALGAIGNAELEALAAGTPVAARFTYLEAYDQPPPLIQGTDAAATAASIRTLLDDDRERERLAAAGRAWILAHHAADAVAGRVLAGYRRILG